jgi:hypothetical protein
MGGHLFRPDDPLNQHLTAADRTAIKSSTGVDVRPDGDILSPMSMSLNDYGAVLMTVAQLASDRANGNGGSLSNSGLAERLKNFGFEGAGLITPAEKSNRLRVDYRA